jgi:hypothetical protein
MEETDGFRLPSMRRAYRCDPDGRPTEQLMVSIDLSEIHSI